MAPNLNPEKLRLLDFMQQKGVRTFADLGGIWNVHGAYSHYLFDRSNISRAYIVDDCIDDIARSKKPDYPNLTLVQDNFAIHRSAEIVGSVDLIIMFDVLLHQVNPNWDEVIELYAKNANWFAVFNQQYVGQRTIRLLELGLDEYFKIIPCSSSDIPYNDLEAKIDEIHPHYGRPYRDINAIWQWGITNEDLIDVMSREGFRLVESINGGPISSAEEFENRGFIFEKAA